MNEVKKPKERGERPADVMLRISKQEYVEGEENGGASSIIVDWDAGATPVKVLSMVIGYLRDAVPSRHNSLAITKIEEAIHWLEDQGNG